MRILVTGSTGLLGAAVARAVTELGLIAERSPMRALGGDLASKDNVAAIFRQFPGVTACIHCAGTSDVDACEQTADFGHRSNLLTALFVSEQCARIGIPFVLASSDYVFDGRMDSYSEQSEVSPLQTYGVTKCDSERVVGLNPESLIVRLPLLYDLGGHSRGFVARGLAAVRSTGHAYMDAVHRRFPTYVDDAARALVGLVKAGIRGTVHVSAQQEYSKLELMRALAPVLGVDAERFRSTAGGSASPRRPARVRLDCSQFTRLGLPAPREVDDIVRHPGPAGGHLDYRPEGREPVVTSSGRP